MKKRIAILVSLLLAVSALAAAEPYQVGVCQLVQHPALDQATQGFIDALTARLGADAVAFDVQNASGDFANCTTIVNGFVSGGCDLILGNATPPLQAAISATADIPILGTSITDYGVALGMEGIGPGSATGMNVSGVTDLAPLDGQAAMIHELFPEAKTVGLIYCSAEPNSIFQVDAMRGLLGEMGYDCRDFAFADSNDVAAVVQNACDNADVLYIPTDNTAASVTETIANVVLPAGKAVVTGEEGLMRGCGVATLTLDYYDVGLATGEMAAQVLGGADVAAMPIQAASTFTKKYNPANCQALGVTVPEGYVAAE